MSEDSANSNPKTTEKPLTIVDVARLLGVSKSTVSAAFTGSGTLSQTTRENVLRAAKELNYEPNPHARRLVGGRCHNTIALFSLNLDLGVSTRKLQLVQGLLDERGYDVLLHARGYYGARHPVEAEKQADLMASVRRQKPRAIICQNTSLRPETLAQLRRFEDEGGIVVCYSEGRATDLECDQVIFDDAGNISLITRHLLELGHREIGLFTPGLEPWRNYVAGFERALGEYGVKSRREWILAGTASSVLERDGAHAAEQFLGLKKRPTAMCVVNDGAAIAFMARLRQAGISVPEQLSVAGFDDAPAAAFSFPALTTVSHPVEEIASQVVALLDNRLQNPSEAAPRHVWLSGELAIRQSTAPLY